MELTVADLRDLLNDLQGDTKIRFYLGAHHLPLHLREAVHITTTQDAVLFVFTVPEGVELP